MRLLAILHGRPIGLGKHDHFNSFQDEMEDPKKFSRVQENDSERAGLGPNANRGETGRAGPGPMLSAVPWSDGAIRSDVARADSILIASTRWQPRRRSILVGILAGSRRYLPAATGTSPDAARAEIVAACAGMRNGIQPRRPNIAAGEMPSEYHFAAIKCLF